MLHSFKAHLGNKISPPAATRKQPMQKLIVHCFKSNYFKSFKITTKPIFLYVSYCQPTVNNIIFQCWYNKDLRMPNRCTIKTLLPNFKGTVYLPKQLLSAVCSIKCVSVVTTTAEYGLHVFYIKKQKINTKPSAALRCGYWDALLG